MYMSYDGSEHTQVGYMYISLMWASLVKVQQHRALAMTINHSPPAAGQPKSVINVALSSGQMTCETDLAQEGD